MEVVIEKGVPLLAKGAVADITDVIKKMTDGDSVFFPDRKITSISWNARHIARNKGCTLVARTVFENGKNGIRIWLVANPTA